MRVSEFLHHFTLHVSRWIMTPIYLTYESVNSDTASPYIRVSEFWHHFTLHTSQWTLTPLYLTYVRVSEFWHHAYLTCESVNSDTTLPYMWVDTFLHHFTSMWINEHWHQFMLSHVDQLNSNTTLPYIWIGWILTSLYHNVWDSEFWHQFALHVSQWILTPAYLTCESVKSDTVLPYVNMSQSELPHHSPFSSTNSGEPH